MGRNSASASKLLVHLVIELASLIAGDLVVSPLRLHEPASLGDPSDLRLATPLESFLALLLLRGAWFEDERADHEAEHEDDY